MIANFVAKLFANKAELKSKYITYRVMYQSPFFELEVDSGNGWQTVHSQEPEVLLDGTQIFQVLRFTSFDHATEYAEKILHLKKLKAKSLFGMYIAPTASYERRTTMIVQQRSDVVYKNPKGEIVPTDAKESKIIPFKIHKPRDEKAVA